MDGILKMYESLISDGIFLFWFSMFAYQLAKLIMNMAILMFTKCPSAYDVVFWFYRKAIAKEIYRKMRPDWPYELCWSYSRCYDLFFYDRWQAKNFRNIKNDVTDEISSWNE